MRFMMLMYPSDAAEAGTPPDVETVAAMAKYNEALMAAGVLRAGEGLHPTSKGARVYFGGKKPRVIDGPFAESKEVLGGYWMIQVKSRAEALDWLAKIPGGDAKFVELRQVYEFEDFPADVQAAAQGEPEMRAELEKRAKQK
jgi:hypothetical protein